MEIVTLVLMQIGGSNALPSVLSFTSMEHSTVVDPPKLSGSIISSVQSVVGTVADPHELNSEDTLLSISSNKASWIVFEFTSLGSVLLSKDDLSTSAGNPSLIPILSSSRADFTGSSLKKSPNAPLSHSRIAQDASNCIVVALVILKKYIPSTQAGLLV